MCTHKQVKHRMPHGFPGGLAACYRISNNTHTLVSGQTTLTNHSQTQTWESLTITSDEMKQHSISMTVNNSETT